MSTQDPDNVEAPVEEPETVELINEYDRADLDEDVQEDIDHDHWSLQEDDLKEPERWDGQS